MIELTGKLVGFDDLDKQIMELLEGNPRMTCLEMGKITGHPDTTVHFRIKRLKSIGVLFPSRISLLDSIKKEEELVLQLEDFKLATKKKVDEQDTFIRLLSRRLTRLEEKMNR